MSYQTFAAYYDRLTGEIDYQARAGYFDRLIRKHLTVTGDTILLDLACGTGSLSVAFSGLGYDVIGVDASADMLAEATGKPAARPILYLCQRFDQLDLYGTIDATVCALDSLNHLPDVQALERAIAKVSLFTAPDGVFLFDMNTVYKHQVVLGQNTFVYDLDDLYCVWQNTTDKDLCTEISLDFFVRQGKTYTRQSESFCERAFSHPLICEILARQGFELLACYAGDTEEPLGETDERAVYLARKI